MSFMMNDNILNESHLQICPAIKARATHDRTKMRELSHLYVTFNQLFTNPRIGFNSDFDALTIWNYRNSLPNDVHAYAFMDSFRRKLTAYLFSIAYPISIVILWC